MSRSHLPSQSEGAETERHANPSASGPNKPWKCLIPPAGPVANGSASLGPLEYATMIFSHPPKKACRPASADLLGPLTCRNGQAQWFQGSTKGPRAPTPLPPAVAFWKGADREQASTLHWAVLDGISRRLSRWGDAEW